MDVPHCRIVGFVWSQHGPWQEPAPDGCHMEAAWGPASDGNAEVVLDVGPGHEDMKGGSASGRYARSESGPATGPQTRAVILITALVACAVSTVVSVVVSATLASGANEEALTKGSQVADGDSDTMAFRSFPQRRLEERAIASAGNATKQGTSNSSSRIDGTRSTWAVANANVDRVAGVTGLSAPVDSTQKLCLTTMKGELCHRLVLWAMQDGLRLHPERYAGLTRKSPLQAFQAVLHQRNPEYCPPPCDTASPLVAFGIGGRGGCNYGSEDTTPAHAGCFIVSGGRLLTTRLAYEGHRYDIPGGQTDGHEPARCTAHREALEETGYLAAPRELLAVVRNNFHIYRCYLLQSSPVQQRDHEASWVGWLTPSEIQEELHRHRWRFPEASRYAGWVV